MTTGVDETACRERLREGMRRLGLTPEAQQEQRLLQFLALLAKWNRAYNLTAVRDPLEMVGRHLLDSLAVLPHLTGRRCLDMGRITSYNVCYTKLLRKVPLVGWLLPDRSFPPDHLSESKKRLTVTDQAPFC